MKTNNLLASALWYAEHLGWRLIPIKPRGKSPLVDDWPNVASSDPSVLAGWWKRWPSAGIGLACGEGSGVWVLDIDSGAGKDGGETLDALVAANGELPDTLESLTGGGGRHLFFTGPPWPPNSASLKLGIGLDVRGCGGQVVLPPSVHSSGQRYEWEVLHRPESVKVAAPPAWLLAKAMGGTNGSKPQAAPVLSLLPKGARNAGLASLAGSMRRRGASEAGIAAALKAENESGLCATPLSTHEVEAVAHSIARYTPSAMPETVAGMIAALDVEVADLDGRVTDLCQQIAGVDGDIARRQLCAALAVRVKPKGVTLAMVAAAVKAAVKAAAKAAYIMAVTHAAGARTIVRYVSDTDTVESLYAQVVGVMRKSGEFFCFNHGLVRVIPGTGPRRVTSANVNGLLASFMEIDIQEARNQVGHVKFGLFPSEHKEAFPACPSVLDALPKLDAYTRSPVFDTTWTFVSKKGHYAASRIFYDGPEIPILEGHETLDRLLSEFCWERPADRVNFIGMLLTAITIPNWPRHPMAVFNANKSQVGKTQLASSLAVIVDGRHPSMVGYTPDDTEFEKALGQQVDNGDRVIVIDNAKVGRHANMRKTGPEIESPVLERSVTAVQLNFRRLGRNDSPITCENVVIFALTVNTAKLSVDLRNRSVPINLFLEGESVDRTFNLPCQPEDFALENRTAIIGELAGMVSRFLAAGQPQVEGIPRHTVSPEWAQWVGSLLEYNGFPGFLSNFEVSKHDYDLEYQTVLSITQSFPDAGSKTLLEWVALLLPEGFVSGMKDRAGVPYGKIKQSLRMKAIFTPYVGAEFVVGSVKKMLVATTDTHEKTTRYAFVTVAPSCG